MVIFNTLCQYPAILAAIISRPTGGHYRGIVQSLQRVPRDSRHIDLLLTDDNLRTLGVIEMSQSIVIEGLAKLASRKKKEVVKRKPGIVIREVSDDERTPTDTEIAAALSRIEEARHARLLYLSLRDGNP